MPKNRVTVTIFGEQYAVISSASPGHLKRLAELVDAQMQRIAERSPRLAPSKVAVLAALSLANEVLRLGGGRALVEEAGAAAGEDGGAATAAGAAAAAGEGARPRRRPAQRARRPRASGAAEAAAGAGGAGKQGAPGKSGAGPRA